MQEFKENKIRETLKAVYELYDNVSDFIFTTFYFDMDFFEEHIITFLMGSDKKISTIGELNATNEWINSRNLCVYYDQSALKAGSSCITLPTFSRCVKDGVFHPKVIVIFGELKGEDGQNKGEKAVYLFVSSCNLTVSGYGRNLEAFSCIKVETETVSKSLLAFLKMLRGKDNNRHKAVCDYLRKGKFRNDDSVELFWNDGLGGKSLLDYLKELPKGDLRIISPYFDEKGPLELLVDDIEDKEQIIIMPAIDGGHYNIHHNDYDILKAKGIGFKEIVCKGDRFAHAKIISKGLYTIIGSYNFTSAAMKGGNAEAALIYRQKEAYKISEQDIDESALMPDSEKLNNLDVVEKVVANAQFSILVDWSKNELTIDTNLSAKDKETYRIEIDGAANHGGWIVSGSFSVELDEKTKRALLRHKQYSVYYNDHFYVKGIIYEVNWESYRPELVCNSLGETLLEWYEESNRNRRKEHRYELTPITDTEEMMDLEKIEGGSGENTGDVFDNYFLVAYSLGRMCKEIKSCNEQNAKTLYGILVSRPGSMNRILDFIEREEDTNNRDEVYYWLVIEYLKRALELLPKKIDNNECADNYEKQRAAFEDRLNANEIKAKQRIRVKKEYLKWIECELFNSGDSDV
jgi:hypothetical protein